MSFAWEDDRIVRGMQQQLRWRRELLASGKQPLGWKLAFGGPAALERLQINAPLVGFLMDDAVAASGSTISFAGWKKPAAEPELAVYLGKALPSGAGRKTTMDAIAGLGAEVAVFGVYAAWALGGVLLIAVLIVVLSFAMPWLLGISPQKSDTG